jgi:O-antigen/teichoic acid export membrane protein
MMSRSAMLTLPALVGFGVLAPDAVPAIYGAKWAQAGQLAQIFSLMAVPYALTSFSSPLLMALGRGAALQTLALGQVIATIVFAILSAPFGLVIVACVSVARSYLSLPFQMWYLQRASGIRPQDSLLAIAAPLGASLVMGVGVWGLMEMIRPHFSFPMLPVLISVAAGMAIYAISLYAISADARKLVRYRLKQLRGRWP